MKTFIYYVLKINTKIYHLENTKRINIFCLYKLLAELPDIARENECLSLC